MTYALLLAAFVISTCGLIYELIAGTIASYLLGDSVTQFSTVIGVYLFSMGVGSFLSRYARRNIILTFVQVEMLVGLIGGCSAAVLFLLFEHVDSFRVLLYGLVGIIGVLIGLEIPLLMRILKDRMEFDRLVSQVFTFDYVGALIASVLFPLVLVPYLGLMRASFLFGILNVAVALWTLHIFRSDLPWCRSLRLLSVLLAAGLTAGFAFSEKLMALSETATFPDSIVYSVSTRYQRIVITGGRDVKLYLNGNLQFSSRDEYRYHEALVHPAMASLEAPADVLVLGGGDGMAVREILKYSSVASVTLVDLDREMTDMFRDHELLSRLNGGALADPRVSVVNEDAFVWLRGCKRKFDFVAVDFPDPSNFSLGKLYTDTFYRQLRGVLKPDGLVVVQSTSPYFARNSYWCVVDTLKASGFRTTPYHAYVPSFGDWGYVIAGLGDFTPARTYPAGLRYVAPDTVAQMMQFPRDMSPSVRCVNRLNNQALVHLFESEWGEYAETH